MTPAQRKALVDLWAQYGIEDGTRGLDWPVLLGSEMPITIEIGFGDGQCLQQLAKAHPGMGYLGIESHRAGAGRLLMGIEQDKLRNVKVIIGDAAEIMATRIMHGSVNQILVFFPDPWPKRRHHKRRLLSADFIHTLALCLKPNGLVHIATDWKDYATDVVHSINAESLLINRARDRSFSARPAERPQTKYEQRGIRLGHAVYDIIANRCS